MVKLTAENKGSFARKSILAGSLVALGGLALAHSTMGHVDAAWNGADTGFATAAGSLAAVTLADAAFDGVGYSSKRKALSNTLMGFGFTVAVFSFVDDLNTYSAQYIDWSHVGFDNALIAAGLATALPNAVMAALKESVDDGPVTK